MCFTYTLFVHVGEYSIKLNHRQLLDVMMDVCGVPVEKFRTVCSAIDKLDKESWDNVRKEIIMDKGLDEKSADMLGTYVTRTPNSPMNMLKSLRKDTKLMENEKCEGVLDELEVLFRYLEWFGSLNRISFDLSLARGLDYYTGVIYEAILNGGGEQVGSIAAGGRYDNLAGMFSEKQVPVVGVSIGIERICTLIGGRGVPIKETKVMVCSIGSGEKLIQTRMQLCGMFWSRQIATEMFHHVEPKMKRQLAYANKNHIPFAIIVGNSELARGVVIVKDLILQTQVTLRVEEMLDYVETKLRQ